jgi:imidazolonepropionase-like amidohydrolase
LGDVTLLPGFMDMHTHITGQLDKNSFNRAVRETSTDAALKGVKFSRITLLAGFTTVRNVGSNGFAAIALHKAIERGDIIGPRIISAGHSLGITGGHCDVTGYIPGVLEGGYREGIADGADEVLKAVRYQIKHGARVIKTCATAGVLSFEGPVGAQQYSYEELKAMVDEAARHGIKVAAHAHGTEGIIAAVRAGVASIEHGSILNDEAIRLMKEHGTYLVPTTYLADRIDFSILPPAIRAKGEYVLPLAKASLAKAIREGVKIAFGTDAAVYPHGENAHEFAALVDKGMSPLEALRTATVNAADLLGVDDRGILAAGKLADIVAVAGNPLEDIRVTENVRFVMKGGKVYKNE